MGRSVRATESDEINELLDDLDQSLKRLRMEYEQFFLGSMKREPQVLKGKVQKTIVRLVNEPPRNARQKFRFNTLNSRFQVYRQLWGRTMRQMEDGTYKRDKFKLKMRGQDAAEAQQDKAAAARAPRSKPGKSSAIDQLHGALLSARKRTGESGKVVSAEDLGRHVRKQIEAIRAEHGDVKVKFKVVVENNQAKVKATISS